MIALHKMIKCINMWLQGLPTNLLNVTRKWDLVAIQAVTCLVSFHWSPVIHSTWGTFILPAMCLLWSMGPVGKYKCLLSFPCVHTNLLVRSGVVNILQRYWSTKNRGKVFLSFFLSFWNENYSLTNLRENWNAVKQKWFKNGRSKSQFKASRGRNTFMWPVKWMLFWKGPVFPQLICREIAQSKLHCCVRERKSNKKQKVIYLYIYDTYQRKTNVVVSSVST